MSDAEEDLPAREFAKHRRAWAAASVSAGAAKAPANNIAVNSETVRFISFSF